MVTPGFIERHPVYYAVHLHLLLNPTTLGGRGSLRRDDELVGEVAGRGLCGQLGSNLRLARVHEAAVDEIKWIYDVNIHSGAGIHR